jgi:uncharacterized membrane protein required for colicin V production
MALFALYGFKKGFIFTAIHSLGWILALAAAYFGLDLVSDFIKKHTTFYDWLLSGFRERFSSGDISTDSSITQLPDNVDLDIDIKDLANSAVDAVARMFTDLTYTLIIFVAIFVIIKLITWILLRAFSNDHKDGFTGFFDGLMGALCSMLKGAVFICLILAVFIPIADFFAPDLAQAFAHDLELSSFTKDIYENNPLLILPQKLFGSIL